jgi:cysteine desulfurase
MEPIYLDYNATTPIDPAVSESMLPFILKNFGNPSSAHLYGIEARKAVEKSRKKISQLLQCGIDEIIFTSGGSESNNYAIKGIARAYRKKGNHIITSQIEHPAVTEVCRYLETEGFKVTYLPVDEFGMVNPKSVEAAITPSTILISIMHANNEVGTIQPIKEIAEIANRHGVLIHSDCAQSVGKIPVTVPDLGVDLLSIAGHKLYGPKGIGVLFVRAGIELEKLIHGANHEMNRRAGTENVIEIAGLGEACELVQVNLEKTQIHLKKLRDRLEEKLLKEFPEAKVNGHPEKRLPNTLSISFPGIEANTILSEMTTIAASAGAACHSDRVDVSHVLSAMEIPVEYAMGTIRLSVGKFTTIAEIDQAAEEISKVVKRLSSKKSNIYLARQREEIKLTQFTHGLGCACKLRPQLLEEIIRKLPVPDDKNILVGVETSDDAAIYRINEKESIVQTVDFFTPIVDSAFHFGAIAAANSLSDIYAMGAKPLFALNIVGFPSNRLPLTVLEEILQGAQSKAKEAGISIIGGHTVDDTEPKFGLAVTGLVSNNKILRNNTAQAGDLLILTKPLGTGILSTALKQGLLDGELSQLLIETMARLNREAAEAMSEIEVHACTDITGFGLIGHLLEMMQGSKTSAIIENRNVPFLPEVDSFAAANTIPGGTKDNHLYTQNSVSYGSNISEIRQLMLNDAQTSGGLLISLNEKYADKLLNILNRKGIKESRVIGKVTDKASAVISVI